MIFVSRSDKDFSQVQTQVWPLALEIVDSGPLKGTPYFVATGEVPKTVSRDLWPSNFLQSELLDTNADDATALLTLQNQFGQIASPVFTTDSGKVSFRFPSSSVLSNNKKSVFREERDGAKITLAVNDYLRGKSDSFSPDAVSVAEASATLKTLQAFVRATTRTRVGQSDILDEALSHTFVALANCLKHLYFQPYACCKDEDAVNIETISVPFIASAAFAHMEELCNAKSYCICEWCGKWKPYRRRVPKPGEHRFCEDKCRAAFHAHEQYKNKKDDRAPQREKER